MGDFLATAMGRENIVRKTQYVKWLYSVYEEKAIKEIVSHPKKGLWFDRVLNFWEKMFDIRIPKKISRQSIFNINPTFK